MDIRARNEKYISKKGFSLVEALLAMSIFALVVSVFVGGLTYGQESTALSGERAQANFLAEEGLEAVRSMRDENFSLIAGGTYGLAISGGQWNFSGTSDTTGIYERSVTISDIDPQTKLAVVNVNWMQTGARSGSVGLSTRLTNWKAYNPTQAEQLAIDVSGAAISGSGNEIVSGISLENTGVEDISLVSTEISWNGVSGSRRLASVNLDGSSAWTGSDSSGSAQDISDFTLNLGGGTYPLELAFNGSVSGITVTILFNMADGTNKQVSFTPGAPSDTAAPANISNLSVSNPTSSSLDLSWTAPGDDGNSGTATLYDIRYSVSTITDSNWDSATQISGEPAPATAGTNQTMAVSGLSPATTYYFAIKAADEVPNISGISNIANGTTSALAQANYLIVNAAGAIRSGRNITGITLQNSGPSNITIATMRISWTGVSGNRRLNSISIGGAQVWTGSAASGVLENITDRTLNSGAAAVPLGLTFNNTIGGINLTIVFNMSDGSTKTVSGIGPL